MFVFICIIVRVANRSVAAQYRFNTNTLTFTCILHLSHSGQICEEGARRPSLHPGVGGAGELVCPVRRPPCGGVEVHVVGVGFESERLAGVAVGGGGGQVDWFVLVALWGRQVRSVAVVVLPVGFVVKWLCVLREEQQRNLWSKRSGHVAKFYIEILGNCIISC